MNISYLRSMIRKGKIVREGEALFVLRKDGKLKPLGTKHLMPTSSE